jgi:cysteinyl-tRNA synthetase
MWEMIKSNNSDSAKKQSLLKFDTVLGLGLKDIKPLVIPPEVQALVDRRETARASKDWTLADELRAEIKSHNFIVDDSDTGAIVKRLR